MMAHRRAAVHDDMILADDDVRYGAEGLALVTSRLAGADLVRPQNGSTARDHSEEAIRRRLAARRGRFTLTETPERTTIPGS